MPSQRGSALIPDLSAIDVASDLKYFHPAGRFDCGGPTPTTKGSGSRWECRAPAGESPATYEVTILGEVPSGVHWVVATKRGLKDEQAAAFFTYVAGLCLPDTDPLNQKAWVQENVDRREPS